MCLICSEVRKQAVKPKDFWRNYRELLLTDKNDHWKQVMDVLRETPLEYQSELANYWPKMNEGDK